MSRRYGAQVENQISRRSTASRLAATSLKSKKSALEDVWLQRLPKSFSNFAFTAASILIIGGHACLKPSPGSFFGAPRPGLLPLVISPGL
jgi:hypothetical protein